MPNAQLELPILTGEQLGYGLLLLSPILVVVLTAAVVLLLDLIPPDWVSRRFLLPVTVLGLLLGIGAAGVLAVYAGPEPYAFGGFLAADALALFFQVLFMLAALLVVLSAETFTARQARFEGEFYTVTLFSTAGLMLMASGRELITIYLGLEVSSLSLAFLAAWNKNERTAAQGLKSTEAGMKFFLLSAMSTAMLLYGMALLYGVTGVTTLADIGRALSDQPGPAILLSITMLVAGFGFKIAAAPFQLWTPDVYQGAPTPVTAFFSVASKAAGFAVILRVFNSGLPTLALEWTALFGVLAFLTMTVGNVIALVQTNVKRLLAYSSITHVGYMLIGLAAASVFSASGVMYYLLAYTFTNLAAFIVVIVMSRAVPDDDLAGYAGLGRRSPGLALSLTAALLSLAGIPPFVGFFAKLYLFVAAIERGEPQFQLLVIWALIMSAVSLYYYGRVIHAIWMREAVETAPVHTGFGQGIALAASVAGVVVLGLAAYPFLAAAQVAAFSLMR